MRSAIIVLISLASAGFSVGQTNTWADTIHLAKKKYEQTKKNCIYLDTVTTKVKQVQIQQATIIDKLKAIREKQIEASVSPR